MLLKCPSSAFLYPAMQTRKPGVIPDVFLQFLSLSVAKAHCLYSESRICIHISLNQAATISPGISRAFEQNSCWFLILSVPYNQR